MSLKNNAPQPAGRRGEITLKIGGAPRTFRFGMNALIAFSQMHAGGPAAFSTIFDSNPLLGLRDMAYCGLLGSDGLPEDFGPEVVGDWIWEIEQKDWNRVQDVMLSALTPGNGKGATTSK